MGRLAVVGEEPLIRGFALAGVQLFAADEAAGINAAWRDLPADTEVVILTPLADQVLSEKRADGPLVVVIGQ